MLKRLYSPLVLGTAGILLFLLVWQLVPTLGLVNERFLPPVSRVLSELASLIWQSQFWSDVGVTLYAWGVGLAIAIVAALVLGFIVGLSDFLRNATASMVDFLRPIPSVALIPVVVLIFGNKTDSAIVLVIYAAFWQVFIQVLYGVTDVDPVAAQTAKSYRLSWWAQLRHLVWPSTLPFFMTGVRLASAVALILAITVELVIGSPGLGQQIALTQASGASAQMYALILTTGMIGVLINLVTRRVEKRVLRWHTSVRSEVAQ